ncbi:unnamed protein product [Closterium sp. Naga37s-1]|nr:unnamed protein product [Closterium sp. Naga37s-1]CAI5520073.1 unnamed protein product [Closterium sp. Naga37s-1]
MSRAPSPGRAPCLVVAPPSPPPTSSRALLTAASRALPVVDVRGRPAVDARPPRRRCARASCPPPSISLATLPSSQPPFLTLSWAACHTSLQAPSPPPHGAPSSAVSAPPPPSPLTPSASSPSSSSPHSFLPSVPFLPSSTSFPSASATWLRVTDCHLVIVTLLPPHTPLLHPPPPLLSPSISPTLSPLPPPLFSPYLLQLLTTSPLFLLFFSLSNTALLLSPPPYGASSHSYLSSSALPSSPFPRRTSSPTIAFPTLRPLRCPFLPFRPSYLPLYLPSSPPLFLDSAIPSASPLFCRCNLWFWLSGLCFQCDHAISG